MDKISIIVPTFNGVTKISRLLQSLIQQTHPPNEVVVVIDGSTDKTINVLEKFKPQIPNLKFIQQLNQGRSIARNNGVKYSSGDIFIFFDDDMEPSKSAVEQHKKFHECGDGILTGLQQEEVTAGDKDIQQYKAYLSKMWYSKYNLGLNLLSINNLFFTSANCSIKRKDFELLGGFDERLTDVEDFDLACRAIEKNIPVYLNLNIEAIHHDRITCKSYILRQRQYIKAHDNLQRLNPHRYKHNTNVNLKKHMYRFFAFPMFPWLVDSFNIFLIFPKFIRYRIYGYIIHSLSKVFPNVSLF